jgi:hypothetical protein
MFVVLPDVLGGTSVFLRRLLILLSSQKINTRRIAITNSNNFQVTVDTYGHLIPGADIAWVDRLDVKTKPEQNATPAQLEDMSETEIPPEVVDLIGGPTRIRTWNQQIMSPSTDSENKGNPQLPSADSGKVLQNPQPRRNKNEQKRED